MVIYDAIAVLGDEDEFLYWAYAFYATQILAVNVEADHVSGPTHFWFYYEISGDHNDAIGRPDGDYFSYITDVEIDGGTKGYDREYQALIYLDFGVKLWADKMSFGSYFRCDWPSAGAKGIDHIYATNNPEAWGNIDHADWDLIAEYPDFGYAWWKANQPSWAWSDLGVPSGLSLDADDVKGYRYWAFLTEQIGSSTVGGSDYLDIQAFRVGLNPGAWGDTAPPWRLMAPAPGKQLVCDHQYGDMLYVGLRRGFTGRPIILRVEWDLDENDTIYKASSGSMVGVQTAELRNTVFGYGDFGADKQIIISETAGSSWDEAQGEFGSDGVTTLEYHETDTDDLAATRRDDQDLIQTLTQREPWSDIGLTPFVARSQLRYEDDIWIGSDSGGSAPVMFSDTGGSSWESKSAGLPNIAINDLEVAP